MARSHCGHMKLRIPSFCTSFQFGELQIFRLCCYPRKAAVAPRKNAMGKYEQVIRDLLCVEVFPDQLPEAPDG